MTQVQENEHTGLAYRFTVTVPSADLEKEATLQFEAIAKTATMQGFRPGKVPMSLLRQRYGQSVAEKVMDAAIEQGVSQLLAERKLHPAMQPKVELVSAEPGKDLVFTLALEVLPQVEPMDFSTLKFERPAADVDPAEVDATIQRLVRSVREPELVQEARPAQKGDVLMIDFDGSVNGTPYPGMKGENHPLDLGSGTFVGTFEEQLIGAKSGDSKRIEVDFPADYHAPHLAGKTAQFDVAVKELRAHKEVELNDETAKEVGFASLADLRKRITEDMAANFARIGRSVLKRALMDKLAQCHDFPIPEGMLNAEFDAIWKEVMKEKEHGHLSDEDAAKSEDALRQEYRDIAARRIRLGLLLAEVAKAGKVEVSTGDLRNAMLAEARRFPGQEKAVIDYYTKTKGAIERLRAPILEEKVVDYILAQTSIVDNKMSAEALAKLPDAQD